MSVPDGELIVVKIDEIKSAGLDTAAHFVVALVPGTYVWEAGTHKFSDTEEVSYT